MKSLPKGRPGPKPKPIRDRLLSRAIINPETGCWEWAGQINESGYGRIFITARKAFYVHRLAYELLVGPIPAGLQLDHLCRVRHCLNPAHLEPVTSRENTLRSPYTMASQHAAKTHCVNGHEFTPENTHLKPEPGGRVTRKCRACARDASRRYNDRVKAVHQGAAA